MTSYLSYLLKCFLHLVTDSCHMTQSFFFHFILSIHCVCTLATSLSNRKTNYSTSSQSCLYYSKYYSWIFGPGLVTHKTMLTFSVGVKFSYRSHCNCDVPWHSSTKIQGWHSNNWSQFCKSSAERQVLCCNYNYEMNFKLMLKLIFFFHLHITCNNHIHSLMCFCGYINNLVYTHEPVQINIDQLLNIIISKTWLM